MGSLDTVPEEEITNPKKGTSLKNEFLMTPRVQGVRIRWAMIFLFFVFDGGRKGNRDERRMVCVASLLLGGPVFMLFRFLD